MDWHDEVRDAFRSGDTTRTRELSERELAEARGAGDVVREVDALCWLSRVALREGEVDRAASLADEARGLATEPELGRLPLHMQAAAARMSGDHARARRLYEESLELNRSLGEHVMAAAELHNLGHVELDDGRLERARELFAAAAAEAGRHEADVLRPYLAADAAAIAAEDGDAERAARLLGAAEAAFAAAGQIPDPDDAADQQQLRERLAQLLGDERSRAARDEGASLGLDEALGRLAGF